MQEKYHLTQQNPISINNQIIYVSFVFSVTKQKVLLPQPKSPIFFLKKPKNPTNKHIKLGSTNYQNDSTQNPKITNHKQNFNKFRIFSITLK